MAAATVAETPTARKPKAFYCTYLGLSGVLTRPAGQVLFLEPTSGAVVSLSDVEVYTDVVVNGEVAEAMLQYLEDMAQGGYAKIACDRLQEVA
jgi:hypothetical protein